MRTVSCTLVVVFLFSLPWRLNSKVTPAINIRRNNWHQRLTHVAEGPWGLSIDAGKENVVSLSRSVLIQHLKSNSGRHISVTTSSTYRLNQRRKRNIDNNLTTMQTQTEGRTLKQEPSSSLSPQAILNTTVFASPVQPHTNISKEWSLNTMENNTQKTTQDTPSTSTGSNEPSTNSDLHTVQPTLDSTIQPSPTTHTHTFTVIPVTDFNETENMKTTQIKKTTTERTTGFDIKTSTSRSVKTFTTTLQTKTEDLTLSPINNQKNPGKAVAAVIGTTFILLFLAIIYIWVRRRKLQKKKLENPEWAGPSPFLDGDVQPNLTNTGESEANNRRGFGQISKYLPQRLSKHLMFQRDTNEEVFMADILQGSSTFGNHNLEDVQITNGEPTLTQGLSKKEEKENHQGPTSVESVDSKSPAVTVQIEESDKRNDDLTTTLSQDTVVKTLPLLVSIDLDSLSKETAPSETSHVGNVPPAPPLP